METTKHHSKDDRSDRRGMAPFVRLVVLVAMLSGCRGDEAPKEGAAGGASPGGAEPIVLAVAYFDNAADPGDSEDLGSMMTNLVAEDLARRDGLAVVPRERIGSGLLDALRGAEAPFGQAAEVAGKLEAECLLIGRVRRFGDRLAASVELVDLDGRVIEIPEVRGMAGRDIFDLAESLGDRIVDRLGLDAKAPGRLTDELTESEAAYRAFVQAEKRLHTSDYAGATELYGEAIAIDPEFALAHYRKSLAAAWQGDYTSALEAAQSASRAAVDLPPSRRRLFRSAALFLGGHYSEALPLVEELLAEEPASTDALYLLSEMYLHSSLVTNVARAAETMLLLEVLDPDFHLLRDHLVLALAMLGRWPEAEARLAEWMVEDPQIAELRHLGLAMVNRLDEIPRLDEPFRRAVDTYRTAIVILQGHFELADELVARDPGEGYLRSWNLRYRADLSAYRGDFKAAIETYREAARTIISPGEDLNGIAAASYISLAEIQELLGETDAARRSLTLALELQPRSPVLLYQAGRLAILEGDLAAVEGHLETLRETTAALRGSLGPIYGQALEAELLLADGRAEEARDRLVELVASGRFLEEFLTSDSSSGASIRQALARAYRALWDQRGEMKALEDLIGSGFERLDHPALWVMAHFRLGELYLEAGDEAMARSFFELFLAYWGHADRPLVEVEEARRYLARRS